MGDPVKIFDLATDMIRLSGFKPGVDIQIEFTGLRTGKNYMKSYFLIKKLLRIQSIQR